MDNVGGNAGEGAGRAKRQPAGITRRDLIAGAVGIAGLFAVGGVGVAFAGDGTLLRPPGAQDEERFRKLCIKCDRCRSACPQNCITIATVENGFVNARTPRLDFHKGICDFCDKCANVCPTGAILSGFDETTQKIGLAVLDADECLALNGGGCRRCVDSCPYEALEWTGSAPRVIADACNGCGICENVCPSGSLRSFSGSRALRGINVVVEGEVKA